jgi:hypothetical protein
MTLKEKFHFAKLSLFNMRLLNDFQNSENNELKTLIGNRAQQDNVQLPINLIHQSSFLSHTYINFVWLWETIKQEKIEEDVLGRINNRFNFSDNISIIYKGDERNLSECKDFLRLIRNAISHGNVDITDSCFIFSDSNPRSNEDYAKIEIKWSDLEILSDDILFSVSNYIYFSENK